MKRFVSLMMILLVSLSFVQVAEAKKLGGGLKMGKSFKTAPAPKNTATNTNTINKPNAAANSSRKGLMGGLLGGLLAGGLLAAFFGGAFEGIQFLDILIMGLIAFVAFKFLKGMLGAKQASMNDRQPAFGGHNPGMNRQTFEQSNDADFNQPTGGFGTHAQSDVPHNYPPGFDHTAFVNGAREHYRILQGAWNFNQLETIKEYVSESLFDDLCAERAKLDGEQHTDVMYVDAEIVRADYDANRAQLSLQFSGRYKDAVEGVEENIEDIWHLERDLTKDNAPWIIVGIQG
jgi:predicted lipid-binding transport protein (Tim44 family)